MLAGVGTYLVKRMESRICWLTGWGARQRGEGRTRGQHTRVLGLNQTRIVMREHLCNQLFISLPHILQHHVRLENKYPNQLFWFPNSKISNPDVKKRCFPNFWEKFIILPSNNLELKLIYLSNLSLPSLGGGPETALLWPNPSIIYHHRNMN